MEKHDVRLEEDRRKIEDRLKVLLPEDGGLEKAMRYSLLAGGKRIRPVLVMELCRVCGGNAEDVLDLACAVEMLHTYSLIHDDLPCMDDDTLRRGKPTNHVANGEWQALLAGDALQAEAFRTILWSHASDIVKVDAARMLADAAGRTGICGGQYLDLTGETEPLDEWHILDMYGKKTAAMFKAACGIGAAAAGAAPMKQEAAMQLGNAIGMAFQVRDDLLNLRGSVEELGKSVGTDAERNKSTLPAKFGIEAAEMLIKACTLDAVSIVKNHFGRDAFLTWLIREQTERKN